MDDEERDWHARVPYPDHPERCQSIGAQGNQCLFFELVPNTGQCRMHGGARRAKTANKVALSQYNLVKFKTRTDHFASQDRIFGLRDEVGVLRMTLETLLNGFQDSQDLIMGSHKVSALVGEIRDTLKVGKHLESAIGELLDRAAIGRLCDAIVAEVAKVVDPDKLERLTENIAVAIANAVATRQESE